jgi:hypothetical protein
MEAVQLEQELPWDPPGWQQPPGYAAGTDDSWEALIRAEADDEECYAPAVVEPPPTAETSRGEQSGCGQQ